MLLYQQDAELLFPARVIPMLGKLRGPEFQELVERVSAGTSEDELEVLGFSLMMIRLASCLTCTADSYRAMTGCTQCALKTIRSYRGSDKDLIHAWEIGCTEVKTWQEVGTAPKDL
jgi:hypothetical protein